jgi:uncharacterized protein with HEPN domain
MISNPSTHKNSDAYLHLMMDSFRKIKEYTLNMSYEQFTSDGKTQSAVIMQLEVIGELAKSVPIETRLLIDIPWKDISGLRDLITHQYFRLDLAMVWHTIQESMIPVEQKIKMYLEKVESSNKFTHK